MSSFAYHSTKKKRFDKKPKKSSSKILLPPKFKPGIDNGPVLDQVVLWDELFNSNKPDCQLFIKNAKFSMWKPPGKCTKKVAHVFWRKFPIQETKKNPKIIFLAKILKVLLLKLILPI